MATSPSEVQTSREDTHDGTVLSRSSGDIRRGEKGGDIAGGVPCGVADNILLGQNKSLSEQLHARRPSIIRTNLLQALTGMPHVRFQSLRRAEDHLVLHEGFVVGVLQGHIIIELVADAGVLEPAL